MGSGKWYYVNKVDLFSQTDYQSFINSGEITTRHRRMDYGHGMASDVPRAFYMQAGGYGQPKDSANILPMVDDHSCVESINLDSLTATLQNAYLADSKASMTSLIKTRSNLNKLRPFVEELFAKTNRFEGYTAKAMEPIRQLSATNYTYSEMRKALLDMAGKNVVLRYGNTIKPEHICSFRAYMIGNEEGVLVVRGNELVAIPREETDVTDPSNHWIILRHDDERTYCIYNLGTGYYLTIGTTPGLSELPRKINISSSYGYFLIREGSKSLGFDSNGQPTAVASNKAARLELFDNYYLTPQTSLCESLLEQTTSEAIAMGIETPQSPLEGEWDNAEGASLSNDIVAVYYYDLQGHRIGYILPEGEPVIAHIILRNGASIVRKILAK